MVNRFEYTQEHVAFITKHYMLVASELTARFNQQFCTNRSAKAIHAKRKGLGLRTGRTGHFEKGRKSWNCGLTGLKVSDSSKRTQFKKGSVPANLQPLGHERICSKDGYILIKVSESNPYTTAKTRYRFKHHVIWEQHNGPIREGEIIRFFDGNKRNVKIENLFSVNKAVNLRLNKHGFNVLPLELREVVRTLSVLEVDRFAKIKEQANVRIYQHRL